MTYHEHLANLSLWFWTEMINHLWQSTLFLLLAIVIVAILRKAAAKSRYTVWLMVSAKFALPLTAFAAFGQWLDLGSFLPSALESPALNSGNLISIVSSEQTATELVSTVEIVSHHSEVYCILTLGWLIGCLLLFALWQKRSRAFKATLGYRNTPTTEREAELLNNAQIRIGLTAKRVNLIVSDSILEPVALGIWQPTVVMPKGLSQKLTDDEFESVLMHELAHIRRRDNLVGILQMALCCLLWFHPLVWLVKRKLLEERERACDEAVVERENKPKVYASGLLKVVQHGLHSHQSAAGVANAASVNLNKRLELIMENRGENMKTRWQKWIVGGAFGALISACVVAGLVTTQASNGGDAKNDLKTGEDTAILNERAQDSKDVSYRIVQADDSPLKITEATGQEITNRQYTKLTGQTTVTTGADGKTVFPNVFSVPVVKMVNNSGKTVNGLVVMLRDSRPNGKGKSYFIIQGKPGAPRAISILPGENYTVDFRGDHPMFSEKYWLAEYTDSADFNVTVARVNFDDGTSWTAKEIEK